MLSRSALSTLSKRSLLNGRMTTPSAAASARFVHIEKRLEELGITLPPASAPKANYDICCYAQGNTMYVSGHLPLNSNGDLTTGKIGPEGESVEHGYAAARQAGLAIVSTLKAQLGDLDRVEQVVKVFGIVQSTDSFKEQHLVMNGCSDVLMEVFGKEAGYHARSAIGTNTLPLDVSVEIEAIIQYKD
ncbi:endoribonuclease L-PSP [Seminavis robusta]|uniref:Endoribonuclease L-PSP n=1 Tax=Seminavis robusta TaxID=568900 RepID=A0A9N8D977_9STRA|nr:endoribonuclease L-PSP [Seminavis robusta]|eukprot:Sro6_g004870.1 endoribonuclease L-PSP (188) ;mRNA; r:36399-37100